VNAVWGIGYLYLSRFWGFDNSPPYVFIVTPREEACLFGKKVAELPKDKPLVTRLFIFMDVWRGELSEDTIFFCVSGLLSWGGR